MEWRKWIYFSSSLHHFVCTIVFIFNSRSNFCICASLSTRHNRSLAQYKGGGNSRNRFAFRVSGNVTFCRLNFTHHTRYYKITSHTGNCSRFESLNCGNKMSEKVSKFKSIYKMANKMKPKKMSSKLEAMCECVFALTNQAMMWSTTFVESKILIFWNAFFSAFVTLLFSTLCACCLQKLKTWIWHFVKFTNEFVYLRKITRVFWIEWKK